MSVEQELWQEYLADVSVPEGEITLPADPKPILKPWQSIMVALATVSVPALLVGDDNWSWDVAALIICGVLGGCFTRQIWYLVEFKRRSRLYLSASTEQRRVLLKLFSRRPLPLHPICVLVVTAVTALGGLSAAQNYGWGATITTSAIIALALLVSTQIRYWDISDSFELSTPNLLDVTGKKSVLMDQSADFPTEEQHKKSGKFKK